VFTALEYRGDNLGTNGDKNPHLSPRCPQILEGSGGEDKDSQEKGREEAGHREREKQGARQGDKQGGVYY